MFTRDSRDTSRSRGLQALTPPHHVMKCGCEMLRQSMRDERRLATAEMIISRWAMEARLQKHMRNEDVVALTFYRSLQTFRLTFLRMRDKCKITNVQRNDKAFLV